tara:strand:+ start:753 stop:1040 length:288 start_codon:yes stop_codon:yes gene_type:complete
MTMTTLDKLMADANLSPTTFHKIADVAPTDPAALQERAEALAAGILSAIKSLEDLTAAYPRADLRAIEPQIDDAYDRCLSLWADVTRMKRNEERA